MRARCAVGERVTFKRQDHQQHHISQAHRSDPSLLRHHRLQTSNQIYNHSGPRMPSCSRRHTSYSTALPPTQVPTISSFYHLAASTVHCGARDYRWRVPGLDCRLHEGTWFMGCAYPDECRRAAASFLGGYRILSKRAFKGHGNESIDALMCSLK